MKLRKKKLLGLEVQQVLASGKRVNTKDVCSETFAPLSSIDLTETVCVLNNHCTEFDDQPILLYSGGGMDNGKGVLGETLAPQSSTDYMAEEVNMNASLFYSAALNSEFMNAKRAAWEGKAKSLSTCKNFRGENYATCSSSVESHKKSTPIEQLHGEKNTCCMLPKDSCNPVVGKSPSVESTSQIHSGTNEEEATMEDDMLTSVDKNGVPENSELISQEIPASGGDENTQNQCNNAIDGQSITVNMEPVENVEMPFIKNLRLRGLVDSLEIFKLMPQKPHFRPLMNFGEAFREEFAFGYMVTFSDVVEKISELQVTDCQNKFDNCLETLAELEKHEFRVKPLVDRVNMLLSMKDEHRQLEDQSKEVKDQLADRISEQVRLNGRILSIDKVLK